ncbi:hypothetical protein METSMIF1_02030 [Methanobrevibacter smithii DSM 2374]|uniref:Uncharacterized protein n=3 Tax=Methanobrevibacter smithii TaxID=2173 RepID=D2ZMI1_METSM|nr:hypothetical protein METSMIALI_01712 [Methanobrevibacter smithii DSM 2375]EFC94059.1 hypothetical protein METSMIF1_02030 [Methanobrevibacter smithii DSM 2374]
MIVTLFGFNLLIKFNGDMIMAKVKGTNKRTRAKRSYTKPGSKRGRGVKQTWKK